MILFHFQTNHFTKIGGKNIGDLVCRVMAKSSLMNWPFITAELAIKERSRSAPIRKLWILSRVSRSYY